jgi:hypothetical protein
VANLNIDNYATTYIGVAAQKGIVVPAWTEIKDGRQEVWCVVIEPTDLK